jgi:hypothetical protein
MSWGEVTTVEVVEALLMCVVLSASELFALFFCSFDLQEVKKIAVTEHISAVNLSLFMILSF